MNKSQSKVKYNYEQNFAAFWVSVFSLILNNTTAADILKNLKNVHLFSGDLFAFLYYKAEYLRR